MIIMSILMYASETWVLSAIERQLVEKEYARLARLALGAWRKVDQEGKWESNDHFLKKLGAEKLVNVFARRKATWIGHLKRREKEDEWAKNFLSELEKSEDLRGEWWIKTQEEFAECGVTVQQVLDAAWEPHKIRNLFCNALELQTPVQQAGSGVYAMSE